MRTPLLLACLALIGSASAAGEAQDTFTLLGRFDGRTNYWTLAGDDARNPDLVVPPNATIHIRVLHADTGAHNLQAAGHAASAYVTPEKPEANYTFNAPAHGTLAYWCQPHKAAGMAGRIVVAGGEESPRETPAEAPALLIAAMLGLALARGARR